MANGLQSNKDINLIEAFGWWWVVLELGGCSGVVGGGVCVHGVCVGGVGVSGGMGVGVGVNMSGGGGRLW